MKNCQIILPFIEPNYYKKLYLYPALNRDEYYFPPLCKTFHSVGMGKVQIHWQVLFYLAIIPA